MPTSLFYRVIESATDRFSTSIREDIIGTAFVLVAIVRPFAMGKPNAGWEAFEDAVAVVALMLLYVSIRAVAEVWTEITRRSTTLQEVISPLHLPDGSHPHEFVREQPPPHFKITLMVMALTFCTILIVGVFGVHNYVGPHLSIGTALLADPIVHLEPENALVWSTTPGKTKGVFPISFSSTNEGVDHITVEQSYFVAERGTDLIFKRVGEIDTYQHPALLESGQPFVVNLDFRQFSDTAKHLMIRFDGPSLFGVRVAVRYRRHADGKEFRFRKGYAAINPTAPGIYDSDSQYDQAANDQPQKCPGMMIISDGFNYQTDSLNADEFVRWSSISIPPCRKTISGDHPISPKGVLRLSDLEFYFDLPGHWVPVIKAVTVGKDGKQIIDER